MVKVTERSDPNPALKGIYDQKYQAYKKYIQALDSAWS
jgi:hypothetical protein